MPTFDTPEPISATIDVVVAVVQVTATDRADTVAEVRPSDPGSDQDVRTAEETRVEFTDGRLLIKAPRQRKIGLFGKPGSIDVDLQLPSGSQLHAETSVGHIRGTGRLGDCRVKTSTGGIDLDSIGEADLRTPAGDIVVRSITGQATVTGSGELRLDRIKGSAVVKNLNGDSRIGTVAGNLRIHASNGDITVGVAGADVTASTANGNIRVGEVTGGVVSVKTAYGELEVGVPDGVAAYLDLHTSFGTMHNRLTASEAPASDDRSVEVRARTSYGDIIIRRPTP
jgi:DUF4097 and DUF4098 domain-containing protein YvlB